ncbi:MAG TPA: ATP-dependent Clp protease adaptor ClpS [Longimicrobiales bacterium]|nr:ATP-dependent Clp protease adaptor ClpS [Longimicrobiales bacterium]
MMATTDQHGQLIYYNAADVGEAGPLVSQFVFWHEMGHFHLGHVAAVPGQILQGVSPVLGGSGNRETDADLFAYHYWKKQRSMHGIRVIESVIEYLERQGNAPGDAEHPPPRDRANLLRVYLDNSLWKIVIHNDDTTSPEFVYGVLTDDFKLKRESAIEFITKVESDGKGSIRTIGEPTSRLHAWTHSITKTKAELLVMDIRLRAMLAGHFQFRLEAKPL